MSRKRQAPVHHRGRIRGVLLFSFLVLEFEFLNLCFSESAQRHPCTETSLKNSTSSGDEVRFFSDLRVGRSGQAGLATGPGPRRLLQGFYAPRTRIIGELDESDSGLTARADEADEPRRPGGRVPA